MENRVNWSTGALRVDRTLSFLLAALRSGVG